MRELDEFLEMFGGFFSKKELAEITEAWEEDECRNAYVLGVWDRDPRRAASPVRRDLIQWLDAHPDRWAKEFEEATGYRVGLDQALSFPENN